MSYLQLFAKVLKSIIDCIALAEQRDNPNPIFKSQATESYCLFNSGPNVRDYALMYGFHTLANMFKNLLERYQEPPRVQRLGICMHNKATCLSKRFFQHIQER